MKELEALVKKKQIIFVESGDHAIEHISAHFKGDARPFLIQNQGGWYKYEKLLMRHGHTVIPLPTEYGVLDPAILEQHPNSFLLFNSMPAYATYQDMAPVAEACKEHNILLINDVSGSIGTEAAQYGDIIFGSFGRWKPLSLNITGEKGVEVGGFIASDDRSLIDALQPHSFAINQELLADRIAHLQQRLQFWYTLGEKVKTDFKDHTMIHPESHGLTVLVRYTDDTDRTRIEQYCHHHNYALVECPKYNRVLTKAISIELKRIEPQA